VNRGVLVFHHPRRTDREIADIDRIERLLREARFCSIALYDGSPYVVTLSFGYDDHSRRLYFHCASEGRKIDAIAHDPRAAATVVLDRGYKHGECAYPYESVVLQGSMRLVDDPAEKIHGLRVLVEHLEDGPDAFSTMGLDDPARVDGVSVLAFDIELFSAKEGE
jgi:uncharacterized protein